MRPILIRAGLGAWMACWALAATAAGQSLLEPFTGAPGGEEQLYAEANRRLSATLKPSHSAVTPGQSLYVAIDVTIDPTYWLYGPVPRGDVKPLGLNVSADAGDLRAGEALYGQATVHKSGMGKFYDEHFVYEGQARFYVPLTVPPEAEPGERTISITLRGQLCDIDQCLELRQIRTTQVTVGPQAQPVEGFAPPTDDWKTKAQWDASLPHIPQEPPPAAAPAGPAARAQEVSSLTIGSALALAFLAGLIFNIMPCVLPVIPLKILSIVEQARHSRRRSVTLGLAYAGGIFTFFLVLGVLSAALRAALGRLLSVNELLAYPPAVIALVLLFVAMALNLFNVFTVSFGGSLAAGGQGGGHGGSWFMGLITAILATPCSFGPLAAVLGWAQVQPAWLAGVMFVVIGAGMALPHVVLTSFPGLLAKLPRPGPWMEYFKQGMGFLLLGVAVFLLTFLGDAWRPWVAGYAVVLAACIWMAGMWVGYNTPPVRRWVVRAVALALAVAAGLWMLQPPRPPAIEWRTFDRQALQAAHEDGQIVLVEFTAAWCVECRILEATTWDDPSLADELDRRNVAAFQGDITVEGTPAWEMLKLQLQGNPPLTVIWPPGDRPPIRLVGLYSREQLLSALDAAAATE